MRDRGGGDMRGEGERRLRYGKAGREEVKK